MRIRGLFLITQTALNFCRYFTSAYDRCPLLVLILTILLGITAGIVVGLFPALPVYTGPIVLYYFAPNAPIEVILIFWFIVVSGSQFFGSISTITTGIPGEESSTVYMQDLSKLSVLEKDSLLYKTALGSFVASVISVGVLFIVTQFMTNSQFLFLSSLPVQLAIYVLALLSFVIYSHNKTAAFLLIIAGIMLSPQNNYALPNEWFYVQQFSHNYTFFMLLVGLFIIPESFINASRHTLPIGARFTALNNKSTPWWVIAKATVIGILAGFVPGPSASIASVAAYNSNKLTTDKIIAAETANNAAVLICSIPLLLLSLPINQNTLIVGNIVDARSMILSEVIYNTSQFVDFSVIHVVLISVLLSLVAYYVLSINLISLYQSVVGLLHHKINWILGIVVIMLVSVDMYSSEVTVGGYLLLLTMFASVGIALNKFKVSPLPLMFAILFGDKIVWGGLQASRLYFGECI